MDVLYEASFQRDLRKIKNKKLLKKVREAIEGIKQADDLSQVQRLKKLTGYDFLYRIRVGDYRIGIDMVENTVIFVRFLHRRDIYRYFP